MKKKSIAADDKFEKIDFNLFEALDAIDRKDYGYYDRLTNEQQKKFVPYLLLMWVSSVQTQGNLARCYVMSANEHANKYMFNEHVGHHPKLQYLMLCAASPLVGKQFHKYIPHIKDKVVKLKERAVHKEVKEYFKKIYNKNTEDDIELLTSLYVKDQHRRYYLAKQFPSLKLDEVELLNKLVSDNDIQEYEEQTGN